MPSNCCCVPQCSRRGGHVFPANVEIQKLWLIAIKRDKWLPNKYSTVCHEHFTADDYFQHGERKRLRPSAVPCVFSWTKKETPNAKARRERSQKRMVETAVEICEVPYLENEEVIEMEIDSCEVEESLCQPTFCDKQTQTDIDKSPPFGIDKFIDDPEAIMYYTGLNSYNRFKFVLNTLGPAAYDLNYRHSNCKQLSIENCLFLSLMKLRRHTPNFELARMFGVSPATVSNVYITWWNFMSFQWREIDIWPSRDLVNFFMPTDFKFKFPKTRIILDGLECPVDRPNHPVAQQRTFSTYKNRNTVKCILGITPSGLVSHIPDSYGGSGSDRQLIERDNLITKLDPKDSIMADKGFDVQDIFCPYDIGVNIPEFFKKKTV